MKESAINFIELLEFMVVAVTLRPEYWAVSLINYQLG